MKIMITGTNGFLGQHLTVFFAGKGFEVFAVSRGENRIYEKYKFEYLSVDLTNKAAVAHVLNHVKPDVVIHNAAMSKPDECHNNRENCLLQNVQVTQYLLDACKKLKPYFIYVSTDFVFGEDGPHSEKDATGPLNFYGESKLMAEKAVQQSGLPNAIMRPVFIYGEVWQDMRSNFLYWVKDSLQQNKPIKVVSDQQRTPTYVNDICNGLLAMINKKANGIFHLAGKDIVSPYDMAVTVAKVLNLDASLIEAVTSETFPEPVQRAKKSGLKIDKAIKELGYNPVNFEEGVRLSFGL